MREDGVEEHVDGGGSGGFGENGLDVVDIEKAQVVCGDETALFEG